MFINAITSKFYKIKSGALILGGRMLKDGRFAFWMTRYWGDLRKVIDLRMERNGNRALLFTYDTSLRLMYKIARGFA
jgi:hypothetical protein